MEASSRELTPEDLPDILENGSLPGRPIPDHLREAHLLYVVVWFLNGDTRIEDFEAMPDFAPALKGKVSKRIVLLMSVYSAEYFRGREVTRRVLGQMRRERFTSRDVEKDIVTSIEENTDQLTDNSTFHRPWRRQFHRSKPDLASYLRKLTARRNAS